MEYQTITMAPAADAVPETTEQIIRLAEAAGMDEQARFQVQVVLAEVLNNIISYAVSLHRASPIRIDCGSDDDFFEVITIDEGEPLDLIPSDRFPPPDEEGGRGWPIIINWMDSLEYQVRDGFNLLSLRKRLN